MFFLILLDTDCSGRMLATILVAWVMTAMIASILLQWEHMWIVLVILTLFFFLICVYTVYTVKKTHARIIIEQQRAAIQTISDIAANGRQTGSLAFAMRSTPDLPPSYASVTNVQETSAPVRTSTIDSDENKFEDPPPYSIVIASTNMQERNTVVLNVQHYVPPATSMKKDDCIVASASSDLATVSHVSSHPI